MFGYRYEFMPDIAARTMNVSTAFVNIELKCSSGWQFGIAFSISLPISALSMVWIEENYSKKTGIEVKNGSKKLK